MSSGPPSADVRGRGCMRGDHGSPVSNRSVSFATCDEISTNKKGGKSKKRRRDSDKSDRMSQKSFDSSLSNSGYDGCAVTKPRSDSVKRSSLGARCGVDHSDPPSVSSVAPATMTEVDTGDRPASREAYAGAREPDSGAAVTADVSGSSPSPLSHIIEDK